MIKKTFLSLLFAMVWMFGYSDIPANYYSKMDGKKRESLKNAAHEIINPHTVVTYNSLFPQQFPKTDVYPEAYNGQERWWEMYSDEVFYVRNGWKGMNREHSFPKSWWGGYQNDAYTDLFHLYPSEASANSAKSNYPLGPVETATFDNGVSKVGYAFPGYGGNAGKVFEPADEYKGDFARTYFYVVTCYQDLTWKYTYMLQQGDYPTLKPWASEMLLDWARKDPVSQKEIDRNEAVYLIQGNRNPFIDFPELAEYIWGTRANETFYVAEQGGTITPPITGEPELYAPVDGSTLDFGEVAIGSSETVELMVRGANLTSALSIRVTGSDRKMFSLIGISENQIPASKINSDTGYKLTIKYSPTTEGKHSAAITLYDGGFTAGLTFNVAVTGYSLPVPELTIIQALDPTGVTDDSYTANWLEPEETVDYYIVNRTEYVPGDMRTVQLIAEENSLRIDDRNPDVPESYTVQSVRLGYKSEPSNMIMIAAGGIDGVVINQPLGAAYVPGGIRIVLNSAHTNLVIRDIFGRDVLHKKEVSGGEIFFVPKGIYILTSDQSMRPIKVIVRE